jgi:protein TonB
MSEYGGNTIALENGVEYRKARSFKVSVWAMLIGGMIITGGFLYPIIKDLLEDEPDDTKIETVVSKVINYSQLSAPPPIDIDKPPPPVFKAPPKVKKVKFVQPVAKKDEEVEEEEYIPTMEELNDVEISTESVEGVDSVIVDAETTVEEPVQEEAFAFAEVMPAFEGGDQELMKYLGKNLRYPKIAKEANIEGVVYLQFVVERDGSITEVRVVRSVHASLDDEAVRVIKDMPSWNPGMQNGKYVRVLYTIPIRFDLQ